MILIDYSQLVIAGALTFGSDFDKGKNAEKQIDILRHTIITTILGDKKKFGNEYGDFVIAVDGRNYWRKSIFPHYKAHRKSDREESNTDWKAIFQIGAQLREEFKEIMPWKFVHVDEAEADDVIAVLAEYTQTNELQRDGLYDDEPQKVLIKSSDGDFGQLHRFTNVRQWNPILKKYVKIYGKTDLLEKILTGDSGDGIPNVKSPDDFFVNGEGRQGSITAKIKELAFSQLDEFNAGQNIKLDSELMERNFSRNRTLIDFRHIPEDIKQKIIAAYVNTAPSKNKGKIFDYFVKNRCKLLLERIQEI